MLKCLFCLMSKWFRFGLLHQLRVPSLAERVAYLRYSINLRLASTRTKKYILLWFSCSLSTMDSESDTQESPIPNSIPFHFMALAGLWTVYVSGHNIDWGLFRRPRLHVAHPFLSRVCMINRDQPRSTWAIWRRNPLWSARVAPCMWTLREVGIKRGGDIVDSIAVSMFDDILVELTNTVSEAKIQ